MGLLCVPPAGAGRGPEPRQHPPHEAGPLWAGCGEPSEAGTCPSRPVGVPWPFWSEAWAGAQPASAVGRHSAYSQSAGATPRRRCHSSVWQAQGSPPGGTSLGRGGGRGAVCGGFLKEAPRVLFPGVASDSSSLSWSSPCRSRGPRKPGGGGQEWCSFRGPGPERSAGRTAPRAGVLPEMRAQPAALPGHGRGLCRGESPLCRPPAGGTVCREESGGLLQPSLPQTPACVPSSAWRPCLPPPQGGGTDPH